MLSIRHVRIALGLVALLLVFRQSKRSLASEAYFTAAMAPLTAQEIADGSSAASVGTRRTSKAHDNDSDNNKLQNMPLLSFSQKMAALIPKGSDNEEGKGDEDEKDNTENTEGEGNDNGETQDQKTEADEEDTKISAGQEETDETEDEETEEETEEEESISTQSTTKSTPTSITMMRKASKPSGCLAVVQRMHEWNHCWREHSMRIQHHANTTQNIQCIVHDPTTKEDTSNNLHPFAQETIGAPFYQFAFYKGQGFGRLIQHTVEACATAFLLRRPCLINLSPRDVEFTWRSFLHYNTYNWDPTLLHTSAPHIQYQLDQLTQLLPNMGSGIWKDEDVKNFTHRNGELSFSSPVLPMQGRVDRDNATLGMQYYTYPTKQQVLLSPNWADAWFTRVPSRKLFQDEYNCNMDALNSLLQNAMYGPTDLAKQLFEEKYQGAVESGKWEIPSAMDPSSPSTNTTTKSTTTTKKPKEPQQSHITPHVLPMKHAHHIYRNDKDKHFGSIHVRVHFLNEGRSKMIDKGEIVTMVRRCLHVTKNMLENDRATVQNRITPDTHVPIPTWPQNWWMLFDDPRMAVDMAGGMGRRQAGQRRGDSPSNPLFNSSIPLVNWYHNYTTSSDGRSLLDPDQARYRSPHFTEFASQHSMSQGARARYAHPTMAGAITDWMALSESQIAIVVHVGSFGYTGARGHGKMPRGYCGGQYKTKGAKHANPFQIYY